MQGLIDAQVVLDEGLRDNPEFREFWERTAPARAVANGLIAYRVAHNLTQTQLAILLGVKQPRIARLETGEHNPTWETLWLLAGRLGLSFFLGIAPISSDPDARVPIWRCPEVAKLVREATVEDITSARSGTQTFVATMLARGDAEESGSDR